MYSNNPLDFKEGDRVTKADKKEADQEKQC